jgi:putative membrane protein
MKKTALAAFLLLAACTADTSQHAHPARYTSPPAAPILAPQDRDFLEKAMEGGNAEINCGGLTRTHSLRGDVQAFGTTLMEHHGAMNGQLDAIAKRYGIAAPVDSLGEGQASYDKLVDLRLEPFDRQFAQVMIEDHQMALELFKGETANGFDPALKSFAASHVPVIEGHLAQAKALAGPKPPPVLTRPRTGSSGGLQSE